MSFINTKWLNFLGLSMPTTVDEFEQVLIYTPQSADGIIFAADGKATITAEQFELNL